MTEYQLNTSGGIKDFKYYVSGALSDIDGILANSNYNKKNVLAHLCYDIRTKGSVKVNYRGALEENNNNLDTYLGNPVIFQGVNTPPYLGSRGAIVDIAPLERKVLFPDEGIYLPGGVPSLLNMILVFFCLRHSSLFARDEIVYHIYARRVVLSVP